MYKCVASETTFNITHYVLKNSFVCDLVILLHAFPSNVSVFWYNLIIIKDYNISLYMLIDIIDIVACTHISTRAHIRTHAYTI